MKANAYWVKNMRSLVDNDREHSIGIDLPAEKGGDNTGATAIELTLMGLAGCITTIYSLYAKRNGLDLEINTCHLEAVYENGSSKISQVAGNAIIKSSDIRLAEKTWKQTIRSCPVGIIFKDAEIEVVIIPKYELPKITN